MTPTKWYAIFCSFLSGFNAAASLKWVVTGDRFDAFVVAFLSVSLACIAISAVSKRT